MTDQIHSSRRLYFRLLSYVKPYRWAFAGAVLGMMVAGAANGALAYYLKPVIDLLFVKRDPAMLVLIPLGVVVIFFVSGVASFASGYGTQWVANKVMMDLRVEMFAKLVRLPVRYYDEHTTGSLMSRLAYDVQGVAVASTGALTALVRDSVTLASCLAVMFKENWKLTLATFAVVPPIAWVVRQFSVRLRQISRESQRANGAILEALDESISAQRVVKVFGGQGAEQARFAQAANRVRRFNMKHSAAAAANAPITQMIVAIAIAFLLYFAALQSESDHTTVGGFVAFIVATVALLEPLKRLTGVNEHLQRGLAACESVFGLIDERAEPDDGKVVLDKVRGEISFANVTLWYRDEGHPALEGVSLHIPASETVALVGATGSGKTSMIHLIPRFYAPRQGRLLIDGHDVHDITLTSLRANIALVSQDIRLFNDTVAGNIAYGVTAGAPRDAIMQAARAAHAWEFIENLPQQLDTQIGENGAQLSGGQRQRIAIARALLKNAPILLLDEATSALDTESERLVQAALEKLMAGRTTIVVAHRLSTVERADRIVVLDKGTIAEIGTHAQLLAKGSLYANLYRLQFAKPDAA
jgi:ATP-binding cassette, subfamily B, bacterial MsbA